LFTPEGIQEIRKIKSLRQHSQYLIISFYDIIDVATAAKYRNSTLNIKKETLPPLKKGVFFYEQIIGLSVYSSDGIMIGKIEDILETGSNDVYIVKDKDKEYLIPAIKNVVKEIDLKEKRMVIEIIDGLLN
jgi:16S rRNA processing protein RimM